VILAALSFDKGLVAAVFVIGAILWHLAQEKKEDK
jgi:hypothetical protein